MPTKRKKSKNNGWKYLGKSLLFVAKSPYYVGKGVYSLGKHVNKKI